MADTNFSRRLRILRTENGLKQQELGEKIGVTKSMVSYYENGREPNFDTLAEVAAYFNVTIEYLLGLTNNRKGTQPKDEFELIEAILSMKGQDTAPDTQPKADAQRLVIALRALQEDGRLNQDLVAIVANFIKNAADLAEAMNRDSASSSLLAINALTSDTLNGVTKLSSAALK